MPCMKSCARCLQTETLLIDDCLRKNNVLLYKQLDVARIGDELRMNDEMEFAYLAGYCFIDFTLLLPMKRYYHFPFAV